MLCIRVRQKLPQQNPAGQQQAAGNHAQGIGLQVAVLHPAEGRASPAGKTGDAVQASVDDMAVEPCQGLRNAAENDFMGDELVNFINIEAVLGGLVERSEEAGHLVGNRAGPLAVEAAGKADGRQGDDHAADGNAPIQMNDVFRPVAADQFAERHESRHYGDEGQEKQLLVAVFCCPYLKRCFHSTIFVLGKPKLASILLLRMAQKRSTL